MNDSSAMYLIFSLLKIQIENLSLNKDDRECRKDIKTLERTECKNLFYNCYIIDCMIRMKSTTEK